MKIIYLKDGKTVRPSVFFDGVPSKDEVEDIVSVLTGTSGFSRILLKDVSRDSVPDVMGAKSTLLLSFKEVGKEAGFGGNGIYGLMSWVKEVLDKAMPENMGASITQPMMFPLYTVDDELFYVIVVSPLVKKNKEESKEVWLSPYNDMFV